MIYDIIIVGGGPAGMSSALYALRENKKVLIIEKESFGGQIATAPRLENFPSIEKISGLEFSDKLFEQINNLGVEFELDDVIGITKNNDKDFIVKTTNNVFNCHAVIIANGCHHKKINLPNEDKFIGSGISYCATCDGPFYKGEEVNIIGDANSAMQYALMLSSYCPKVTMYALFDHLFGDAILKQKVYSNPKIDIKYNMSLTSFEGDDTLTGLTFKNTKTNELVNVKTNNVFIAIGQQVDNNRFSNLVKLDNGYIVVDSNMETSTKGIFAAGDTIKKDIRQVINACSEGSLAAINAVKYLS